MNITNDTTTSNIGHVLDLLIQFLSSDAIGNAALLVSAIIGIGGSYKIYMIREARRRERIKNGIKTEIEEMNCLSDLKKNLESSDANPPSERIPAGTLPNANELPTMVFDANTDEIARLDQDTASEVISFYSDVKVYKSLISEIKNDEKRVQNGSGRTSQYRVPIDKHKELYENRDYIEQKRNELLDELS